MEITLIICVGVLVLKIFLKCFKTPTNTLQTLIKEDESICASILLKTRIHRVPVAYLEKYQWN
jgi:hypothetical protein